MQLSFTHNSLSVIFLIDTMYMFEKKCKASESPKRREGSLIPDKNRYIII